jgi:hypothetical protein
LILAAAWLAPFGALAQTNLPPEKGGVVYSLGMPPVYKGHAGAMIGWYRPGEADDLAAYGHFGILRDLGSPVVGMAALGLEGYIGYRGQALDGGGRALFSIPVLHFTVGGDYNVPDEDFDLLLRLELPVRRGGLFGRGSQVRIDYLPTRKNTLSLGVNVPLWGRNIGETRPQRDNVKLAKPPLRRIEFEEPLPALDESLARIREGAHWIMRLATPLLDRGGADPREAYAEDVAELQAHLAQSGPRFPQGRSYNEEIRVFHAELDRAFSIAEVGRALPEGESSQWGREASAVARRVLLDEVVFPYNRLLGQRKTNDSLDQFAAVAHQEFARWILNDSGLPEERFRRTYVVFQKLVEIVEEIRAAQRERWDDSRFVWLPLQLGLRAEDHDSEAELDDIIERAVDSRFSSGNRVWYVMNEEFQFEMARSVHRAEDYHVLWIHDFRGKNSEGEPDELAFRHVVGSYLSAMTRRVREYDETGKLPLYFIFLDQHYFEINKGRMFLRVLHEPMDYELNLPGGYEEWEYELAAAQDSLRQAVAESRLLQVQASQYGEKWLKKLLRVHINITNPADLSFNSWHVAGIIPVPDNIMRDHRKIAFYDVTEDDPYRGLAMYTGMGIGEHYAGRNWEDRAIMIQGPSALTLRDAARNLLRAQGFTEDEIPIPLRSKPKPPDYDARVDSMRSAMLREWETEGGRVMELHNETGFQPKPINVAKAVLYSLMPAGSLLKIPDSLWQNYVYASLLAGSALRGCKVLIFAPALASAPSSAGPTMARAHGLFSALIYFQNELGDAIEAEGGLLKTGLYSPRFGVGDLRGRVLQARETVTGWLRTIYPPNPAVQAVIDSLDYILEEAGYESEYLVASDTAESTKLHMKANMLISGPAWRALNGRPEWGPVMREYLAYLARQAGPLRGRLAVRDEPAELAQAMRDLIHAVQSDGSAEERAKGIAYLTVGSANMDYRSMVMDGEVMVTVTGWQASLGIIDFLLLNGLCEWVDDLDRLEELLPPPGGMTRSIANLMKLAL